MIQVTEVLNVGQESLMLYKWFAVLFLRIQLLFMYSC